MDKKKCELRELLIKKSFKFSINKPFILSSGRESQYYVDTSNVSCSALGLSLIGEIFFDMIKDLDVHSIGGMSHGADPIAYSTSITSFSHGKSVGAFSIRNNVKLHGVYDHITGDIEPGNRVVIVEDVVTTGCSVLRAIYISKNFGLDIIKVLILVDREEGGYEAIEKEIQNIETIFKLSDLKGIIK